MAVIPSIISSPKIPDLLYLIGSIVLSSYLVLSFKILQRMGISSFQAIVFNYWTCVITGSVVNGRFPLRNAEATTLPWFPWALLMGGTFIFLFNIIAFTARNNGVAVASVANKLSLVIPILFSIFLYKESIHIGQWTGIFLALLAVVLTCYPAEKSDTGSASVGLRMLVLPVILFFGSGLLDTMIKFVEHQFLNGENNNDYLITAFLSAASIGAIILTVQQLTGSKQVDVRAILAGILIGIPNYFSIWCLIRVLKQFPGNSSMIIPVNNMGIVLFSAVAAYVFFKERLSFVNWSGIAISLLAIGLIAFAI